jgi:ArsR family transcriptional regulator
VVVLELMPHTEEWVSSRLGHHHLGFEPSTLIAAMTEAGFTDVRHTPSARDGGSPFRAFLLTGTRSRKSSLN